MKKALTEIIFKFVEINSAFTKEQILILHILIGYDWEQLANACELINVGIPFDDIRNKAVEGKL